MDLFEKSERKRQARHRVRAQRERAARLETRVVAISLICFALLWGVIFVQMATGNDPVLGDSSSTVAKGSDEHRRHLSRAAPAETKARTDSEELGAIEPEELEEEAFAEEPVEEEPVEAEAVEAEPTEEAFVGEEPAPVTTGQS
jgi:cytoskeletal protein RodZ